MYDVFVVSRVNTSSHEWIPVSVHGTIEKAQAKVAGLVVSDGGDYDLYRIDRVARED